ncbi:MAG: hypothetical protein ACUVV0_11145, partial [Anaerolineae bacterium]
LATERMTLRFNFNSIIIFAMELDRYATVLVAVMNNKRDFAIARDEGWYRIPVKNVPKRAIGAPALAFYQTAAFGGEKWAVNYYALTTFWEVVKRRELFPDEPNHPRAEHEYYKVHLSPLQRLPRPIPSRRWRRITFIVTFWERLFQAEEINDLIHGTIWEEKLWAALRKAGIMAERRYEFWEGHQNYVLDFAIFCREGCVAVSCGEEGTLPRSLSGKGLRFSPKEIQARLPECLKAVQEAIGAYGGTC